MKRSSPRGFTLIELVVVIAVVLVLAALTIGIVGIVIRKGSVNQAREEIRTIQTLCEAYKIDHGNYPQNADTSALDPRSRANPNSPEYHRASVYLYSCLTGDFLPTGAPDGNQDSDSRSYASFAPKQLKTANGGKTVLFLQDPFGNSYGYSTAGAEIEAQYRASVRSDPNVARPAELKGFSPAFDLWSTGGGTTLAQRPKWVTNWAD